jgi:DNA-binding transcriptional regulator GbsR (MarR family)
VKRVAVQDETLHELVEEYGLWFERTGLPRMAGRILGWLLLCDPPEQSQQDLAAALQASMGSVSTMTRMLEQMGLVERVSVPGERRVRFRVRPYAWSRSWSDQIERAKSLQDLVERSLDALASRDGASRLRLEVTREFAVFYQEQLPLMIEAWERRTEAQE